jgi:hypothetical protein
MSDDAGPFEHLTPAQARLDELLEPLRAEPPAAPAALSPAVLRSARWQGTAREALRAVSHIALAAADVFSAAIGRGKGGDDR